MRGNRPSGCDASCPASHVNPGLLGGLLYACASLQGFAAEPQPADLTELTLEQLGKIEITSVSRQPEPLAQAAASIFVITGEDIRRSGATNLSEALRLAPNLQVARTSARGYAISARGFNNAIGNKLLVLIDGRTVYTPLFSGVFWDQQEVMLEDVERIEVISGPGATLWGANAVNGVINVITRPASATQGGMLTAGIGNRGSAAGFRYGGTLGDRGHFRVYGQNAETQNTENAAGVSIPDGWRTGQIGFRSDWSDAGAKLTVQGDAYRGRGDERTPGGRITIAGMNLLARWTRRLAAGSELRLQSYYDRTEREDVTGFQGDVDTFDVELQHAIPLGPHRLLWGAGYRRASDDVQSTLPPLSIRFLPASRTLTWKNVFVQSEVNLTRTLDFTAGIKLESNDYTGWEYLPSARLAWKPANDKLLWAAASRAVRAPARLDRDFFLVFTPLNFNFIQGGPYFEAEIAKVYELGYRASPSSTFSYSVTAFRQNYEKLRSGMPPPAFIENKIEGFENGIEAWGSVQVTPTWRLSGGFSTLRQHLGAVPGSTDPTGPIALGNDPDHQWLLRSSFNLSASHELDVMVRRVASLPAEAPQPPVPAYTAVDLHWGWRIGPRTELALTLQNLFDRQHAEFTTDSVYGRSAFLKLLWRL
jgi:iron complex outermembrane receptor protein